jgi:ABC-2 type transport system permease protein
VPLALVGDSLGVSRTAAGDLSPWTGLAVLSAYAAVALAAGAWTLTRRDA